MFRMQRDETRFAGAAAAAHAGKLDGLGLTLSAICLVHCLALPVALTLLPTMAAGVLDHADFHKWMLVIALPASLLAFGIGCRRHRRLDVLILGGLGLTMLAFAAYAVHAWDGELERYVTIAGGLVLAFAHIQNFRICRRNDCDHGL